METKYTKKQSDKMLKQLTSAIEGKKGIAMFTQEEDGSLDAYVGIDVKGLTAVVVGILAQVEPVVKEVIGYIIDEHEKLLTEVVREKMAKMKEADKKETH